MNAAFWDTFGCVWSRVSSQTSARVTHNPRTAADNRVLLLDPDPCSPDEEKEASRQMMWRLISDVQWIVYIRVCHMFPAPLYFGLSALPK